MAQNIVSPPPQMLSVFPGSPVLPPSIPYSSQVEVLERLKHLRAWQQQQQAALLQRQQEQLMKLKGEAMTPEVLTATEDENTGEQEFDVESPLVTNDSGFPYVQLLESPLSNDVLDETNSNISQNANTSIEYQPLITPTISKDDRPLKPVKGTFDDFIERQLQEHQVDDKSSLTDVTTASRKPFLRKGQGIARFGMKKLNVPRKEKSGFKGQINGRESDTSAEQLTPHQPGHESSHQQRLDDRSAPIQTRSIPLSSSMVRCSSEDSFIVRRNNRLQQELEELSEFEYLERMAVANSSFSSQNSLVISNTPSTALGVELPSCTPQGTIFDGHGLSYAPQKKHSIENTTPTDYHSSPALVENLPSNLRRVPALISNQHINDYTKTKDPTTTTDVLRSSDSDTSDVDLDNTLTPSQTHGLEFNDDEVWDSFNHGSPPQGQSKSVSVHNTPQWKSPVTREKLDNSGQTIFTSSLPATIVDNDQTSGVELTKCSDNELPIIQDSPLPPPPSALVAKLFPALRKTSHISDDEHSILPTTKTTSPTSSTSGGDSGKGSLSSASALMNDELKEKLCQLELEIERYKAENSSLEKLRVEREEELSHLKAEISEFRRQKDDEIKRFEEYKKDEIKKLKRDRKIFENYQLEARTARDKKDKEEILSLRQEIEEIRQELQHKEARWGATLSRYRVKIEGLEARNKELMNDIKMMEEARLEWWQEQINQQPKHQTKTSLSSHVKGRATKHESKVGVATSNRKSADKQVNKKPLKRTTSNQSSKECPSSPLSKNTTTNTSEQSNADNVETTDADEDNDSTTDQLTSPEIIDVVSDDYYRGTEEDEDIADGIVNEMLGAESAIVETTGNQQSSPKRPKKSVKFTLSVPSPEVPPTQVGMMESVLEDGSKVIKFDNGNRKVLSKDGQTESVYFFNGDVKHTKPDKTVEYFYFESKVTHTTYPDGLQVYTFPNHQTEKHYPNGTKEILFPNKTVKYVHPNGDEESVFPDGTVQRVQPNGDLVIEYTNGQRDTHTKEYKCRHYPDGSVKTVYSDGHQETRYPTGRVRVKDKTGKIIVDEFQPSNKPTHNNN